MFELLDHRGRRRLRQVSALAVPLARARGAAVHVLHVIETDVLAGEDTAEFESPAHARELLDACVAELREAGVPVRGELLHSYGTHTDVARQLLRRAADLHAGAIVLGPDARHATVSTAVTAYIAAHAPSHVIVINPDAGALGPLRSSGLTIPGAAIVVRDASNLRTMRAISHPVREELSLPGVLHALSDPVRLEIVEALRDGAELPCGMLDVSVSKSTLSHHLKVLRDAGVTQTRAQGVHRFVSLRTADIETLFPGLLGCVLGYSERHARHTSDRGA